MLLLNKPAVNASIVTSTHEEKNNDVTFVQGHLELLSKIWAAQVSTSEISCSKRERTTPRQTMLGRSVCVDIFHKQVPDRMIEDGWRFHEPRIRELWYR